MGHVGSCRSNGSFGSCGSDAASSSGASFFAWQRRARNASDWWWTARDHGKGTDSWRSASRPLSPSRAHFHQKRDVWVRGRVRWVMWVRWVIWVVWVRWVIWVRISPTTKKKWPIASPLLLGALSNSEFLKQYRRSVRINRVRCFSVFGCGPVLYWMKTSLLVAICIRRLVFLSHFADKQHTKNVGN